MLRLLLDEHISPAVATQITRHRADIDVVAVQSWGNAAFLGVSDDTLLAAAHADGRTLVTYDQNTIGPLLKTWGETGTDHGGVIFVDHRTLVPNDFGGLVHALIQLWDRLGMVDWTSRVVFLSR